MNEDQAVIDNAITNVKRFITLDRIEEAFKILKKDIAPISEDLDTSIILQQGSLKGLNDQKRNGTITEENYNVGRKKIAANMISLMATVDEELEVKRILGEYNSIYVTSPPAELEKIHGSGNNLVPMSWIYKCIEASKSVCQVRTSAGNLGTGWMLEDGWMMTNFHVIPNKDIAASSKIVFDFEEDLHGGSKETIEYKLDPEGAIFSPIMKLDYAYIKVIDNPADPIANRGFLEVDTFSDPQVDDRVAIIQHPKGEKKQIALTENKITAVDGNKLFYLTDTHGGSSGSPVLGKDWKVVGLHHAGRTEAEGGVVIDSSTGKRAGANEGLLIKAVMADIKSQQEG
ncbi:MAG: trypsin-like peptidase domain-containing protein [Saprospiraceae bacterium]|nr:trypsin-like peptidase domain-containing protein [Saprospiraceae bacterium]